MWTCCPCIFAVVKHAWLSTHHIWPPDQFLNRLKRTKNALSVWNKCQFGKLQSDIARTQLALEECQRGNMDSVGKDQDMNLRQRLDELLKRKELLWFQKLQVQ